MHTLHECWLGIDFSGDDTKWRPSRRDGNVWIAKLTGGEQLALKSLQPVQAVEGHGQPFERLARLLEAGEYAAAAIDAPFSIPLNYVTELGGHASLLKCVADLPRCGRSFAKGEAFVREVSGKAPPLSPPKPLRKTEEFWATRGVNVRSTLWVKPRGGAPMTVACLSMLHLSKGPIWPWVKDTRGLLVEAFPAAQLRAWGLPHQGYNGGEDAPRAVREQIVTGIRPRIDLGHWTKTILSNADALDAVLCAFAAVAVTEERLHVEADEAVRDEGWIAVHR